MSRCCSRTRSTRSSALQSPCILSWVQASPRPSTRRPSIIELTERAIPFRAQVPLAIRYRERFLEARYIVDVVCYGKILVELKALDRLSTREQAQTINYLKASQGLRVALLINFGSTRVVEWKRFVL